MDSGQLVPDALMLEVIKERLAQPDCQKGSILDGFPRTVPQAEALSAMLESSSENLDAVCLFDLSEEALSARLENRRGQEARVDDSAEVQKERLRVYQEKTAPLISYYEQNGTLKRVDASGSIEEVSSSLFNTLGV